MPIALYDLVGFAGAGIATLAYFLNQQRLLRSDDWRFPAANLVAASLILVSLCFEWNFPSVVIEIVWAAISLWGLVKALTRRAG